MISYHHIALYLEQVAIFITWEGDDMLHAHYSNSS